MYKQLFPRGLVALGFVLSTGAGCESGLGLDDPGAIAQPAPSEPSWTKVEPSIIADVQAGRSRDVLVVLADEPVRRS